MKKILFCDMDGTIIENNLPIHHLDIEMIHELRKQGYYFAFCTGRNLEEAKIASHHFEYDFMVLNNGAMIVDQDDRVLYHKQIKNQDAKEILDYCMMHYPHLQYSFYNGQQTFNYYQGKTYVHNLQGTVETKEYQFINELNKMKDDFDIFCAFNPDETTNDILEIQDYINRNYQDIQGTQNVIYLDVTVAHCSKGTGIQALCQILNEELQTYCIGDSFNDQSMFKVADYAYTFNRVTDEIKKETDKQVDYVYEVIQDMLK